MATAADEIVADIDTQLAEAADPDRAEREAQYLRSQISHIGVGVPALHKIAGATAKGLDRDTLLAVCLTLWDADPPVHERRFLAADLLANRPDLLGPGDLPLLERLIREARTWAIIDTLAPRVAGPVVERFPDESAPVLDAWSTDDDFWVRRAALLAHLIPLRQGRGDWDRFCRYADGLLDDRELFVAKAIGWVLRDTARKRPDMVLAWSEPRMHRMGRVTAREVVKPYPPDVQDDLRRRQRGSS